jgi:hypothetical protein
MMYLRGLSYCEFVPSVAKVAVVRLESSKIKGRKR